MDGSSDQGVQGVQRVIATKKDSDIGHIDAKINPKGDQPIRKSQVAARTVVEENSPTDRGR